MPYHVDHKRPHLDLITGKSVHPTDPNGIKLERLIFDSFCQSKFEHLNLSQISTVSQELSLLASVDQKEFAPLKYPDSFGGDCLFTCLSTFNGPNGEWIRHACTAYCQKLMQNAKIDKPGFP
jgi:hypothetical protein